jgi:hypothetical protein
MNQDYSMDYKPIIVVTSPVWIEADVNDPAGFF